MAWHISPDIGILITIASSAYQKSENINGSDLSSLILDRCKQIYPYTPLRINTTKQALHHLKAGIIRYNKDWSIDAHASGATIAVLGIKELAMEMYERHALWNPNTELTNMVEEIREVSEAIIMPTGEHLTLQCNWVPRLPQPAQAGSSYEKAFETYNAIERGAHRRLCEEVVRLTGTSTTVAYDTVKNMRQGVGYYLTDRDENARRYAAVLTALSVITAPLNNQDKKEIIKTHLADAIEGFTRFDPNIATHLAKFMG